MKKKKAHKFHLFALISFLLAKPAFADVNFLAGYAVIGGAPVKILQGIYPETVIVCDPTCIIVNGDKKISITYPGFGTLEKMCKVAAPQTSVDHLVATLNGKINFKIGSIVVKETKKLDLIKAKATPTPEPLLDEPLPDDARGLIAHQISMVDQLANLNGLYPENGALLLHHKGGEIFVVPQRVCIDSCELTVSFNGSQVARKKFKAGQKTFVDFNAVASNEGIVHWVFVDGDSQTEGAFELKRYNATAMAEGIKDSRPIEIIP